MLLLLYDQISLEDLEWRLGDACTPLLVTKKGRFLQFLVLPRSLYVFATGINLSIKM